jgi:hypothetical protein
MHIAKKSAIGIVLYLKNKFAMAKSIFYLIHLLMAIAALGGPWLFSWYLMAPAYLIVSIQFLVLKECVFNRTHQLDKPGVTFYSDILNKIGLIHNESIMTKIVRTYLYPILLLICLLWQVVMGNSPLLF